jgi:hypothetical protein
LADDHAGTNVFPKVRHAVRCLEREKTQQAAGYAAEDAVENLLDGGEQTIDDLVEGDDKLAQGKD